MNIKNFNDWKCMLYVLAGYVSVGKITFKDIKEEVKDGKRKLSGESCN